jgi:hypothetical protein
MDRADIVNNIMEIGRKEENTESTSLLQMKEMGINIGTARNEPFTGRQIRHVNQHGTGTIRFSTLMGTLRRREGGMSTNGHQDNHCSELRMWELTKYTYVSLGIPGVQAGID